METYLSISESGRSADAAGVAILEGTPKEVRRWTVNFILLDRLDGHPKAAAFHDGKRFKATAGEFAEAQVEMDEILEAEAKRLGLPVEVAPEPPPTKSLRERMAALRA